MDIEMKILKKAREIITPEDCWTKGTTARNKQGHPVEAEMDEAVIFCAEGAIQRAAYLQDYPLPPNDHEMGAGEIEAEVICILSGEIDQPMSLNVWNDNPLTTHKDVLELFDRAITNYSGQEE